jgi:hypothetical protein
MRIPFRSPLWALLCLALAGPALAQDAHYWTNPYGTRATLLGGAVIGSVLDLSGTFYNPGGMSLIEKPQTVMAANMLQYPRLSLVGSHLEAVPLNAHNPGPAPTLVAGTIRIRGQNPRHWFGYSYLARQVVKLGASISGTGVWDIIPGALGSEDYAAQFRFDEKIAENWLGLTWSYRLARGVGLGVSQYLAVRSHWANVQEHVEVLTQAGGTASALGAWQYRYNHFRVLWKVGLAVDLKALTLGLTVTTPSVAISGRGMTGIDTAVVNLDVTGDGTADNTLAANYQDGLPVAYRSPFSLAMGVTFKIRKVRIYLSGEWFDQVRPYTVVDAEEFSAQSTGEILSTDVTQELEAVLNTGFGLEWFYSSRFKGYASFSTDYSARMPGTATNIAVTDWDNYHFMTGAEFFIKRTALTVGLGYSFGSRAVANRPGIIEHGGVLGAWDPFEDMKFHFATYKLIIGIAI